ncbi:MAG: archease [Pyrobaculum sp.]
MSCAKPTDFRYGEHTADVLVLAYGCTLDEAFKNAAVALADLTYYSQRVEPRISKTVEIEYDDLEGLLFKWIDELLYLFDGEKLAISRKIDVAITQSGGYKLKAVVYGEPYDIEKHGFTGLIVKAMTFHMMEIRKEGDYWVVQYVVDI